MGENTWKTAITKIEPNKITVHGYKIDELMGRVSFSQMIYLLLKGELPGEKIGKVIEAIIVSSVDHGITPPSCIGVINSASTGAPVNAALAAGILCINQFHGGAIENCMKILHEADLMIKVNNLTMDEACEKLLKTYKDKKKRLEGFGHRVHTNDPRTKKLFEIAKECGISGRFIEILKTLERKIDSSSGKKLPINVDGAIAGLLCEMDFKPDIANAFFIIARIPGLLAHIQEEKSRYKPMRKIDYNDYEYDGKPERRLA